MARIGGVSFDLRSGSLHTAVTTKKRVEQLPALPLSFR